MVPEPPAPVRSTRIGRIWRQWRSGGNTGYLFRQGGTGGNGSGKKIEDQRFIWRRGTTALYADLPDNGCTPPSDAFRWLRRQVVLGVRFPA